MLTREAILAADDLPREKLPVPEWKLDVYVRTMAALELEEFLDSHGDSNVRAQLAARVLVDEEGARLFQDDDASALAKKSYAALNRVWKVAARLNSIVEDEDAVKNSKLTPEPASS